jgi:hypothetical protein
VAIIKTEMVLLVPEPAGSNVKIATLGPCTWPSEEAVNLDDLPLIESHNFFEEEAIKANARDAGFRFRLLD